MGDRGGIENQTETPLPWKQIRTLLLLDHAEYASATIIWPFIVEFIWASRAPHEKHDVGYYVGIVEALFFLTQAVCVPRWGLLSDRIGRKPVLVLGLLGLAFATDRFGRSKSFLEIAFSRVLMGGLNGNSNIVKSALRELTDESNRAKAYSFILLAWFIVSIMAPLVGGSLTDPAQKFWPIFFQGDFWREYPYYLPCWMATAFSLYCCIIALLRLHETNPRLRNTRYRPPLHSGDSEIALLSARDNHVNRIFPRHAAPTHASNLPRSPTTFRTFRSLFNDPVRLSLLNYGLLAFLDASFRLLLPLFLATTATRQFVPITTGNILCYIGLTNCVIQVTLFSPLYRLLGSRSLYSLGLCSFGILFATLPFITEVYAGGLGTSGFAAVLQMALYPIAQMSFRAISLYVEGPSASNPTRGTTNGIAQTVVSISRAFGSLTCGSLFALSMRGRGHSSNNLVYYVLGSLAALTVVASRLLPTEVFQEEVEQVQAYPSDGSV